MLAYVFWHWKRSTVMASEYESRQRAFHDAMAAAPPAGYHGSFTSQLTNAPWAAGGGDAYEDWYFVEDFTALGVMNLAAITASRTASHDAAAAAALDGTAGLYGLRRGAMLKAPKYAHWFAKTPGVPYPDFMAQLAPIIDRAQGALWMREMVLGPSPEFCLHTMAPPEMPAALKAVVMPLRTVWP
jgi:hypothetical protein